MAVTTTTTVGSQINSEVLVDYIQDSARNHAVMLPLAHAQELGGSNSASASFAKVTALTAPAAGDQGTTGITAQAFTLTDVVATAAPYEMAVDVSKQALRTMRPAALMHLVDEMIYQLANKIDAAGAALFAGLDAGVGSSGVNITPDVLNAAAIALHTSHPARSAGRTVICLHQMQIGDLRNLLFDATNGLPPGYSRQDLMDIFGTTPGHSLLGLNVGRWGDIPILQMAQVATANAGADRAGAMFIFGEGGAFGCAVLWHPEIEEASLAAARISGKTYLGDVSFGWIEIDGTKGQKIVTDA